MTQRTTTCLIAAAIFVWYLTLLGIAPRSFYHLKDEVWLIAPMVAVALVAFVLSFGQFVAEAARGVTVAPGGTAAVASVSESAAWIPAEHIKRLPVFSLLFWLLGITMDEDEVFLDLVVPVALIALPLVYVAMDFLLVRLRLLPAVRRFAIARHSTSGLLLVAAAAAIVVRPELVQRLVLSDDGQVGLQGLLLLWMAWVAIVLSVYDLAGLAARLWPTRTPARAKD